MNDQVKGQWQALQGRWQTLEPKQRSYAIMGLSAVAALAAVLWMATGSPRMDVLFSQLTPEDSAQVTERLATLGVPYKTEDGGKTVLIPSSDVHATRLTLAAEGVPSSGSTVGFEVFDENKLGESEFSEQVKYHRALEGELSRTLSHLRGVRRARVHLVLPKRSLFVSDKSQGSASVVLHMNAGSRLREAQVEGVVHLVASSVRDLEPDRIAVVDGQGRNLLRHLKRDEDGERSQHNFREELEQNKEHSLQRLLDETLGEGKAVVRVAAEVTLTRQERTEELYDPQAIATRSFEVVSGGGQDGTPTPEGVPGAVSNLPGGPAAGSVANGTAAAGQRSERRNFEVTKRTLRAVDPSGRLERLQVAVVVDGKTTTNEAGETTFEALPKEELDRIRNIVASAAGIREDRGDRVTIECVQFAPVDPDEVYPELIPRKFQPYLDYLPQLAMFLGGLFALLWFRRWRKRARKEKAAQLAMQPAGVAVDESGVPYAVAADVGDDPFASESPETLRPEDVRGLTMRLVEEDPERSARVIRAWLTEAA